jgi:hypothetical protein
MPQAIDLALKNAAAQSKTFSLATPAGPTGSAVWYLREGANPSIYPKIECSSATAAGGAGRKVKLSLNLAAPTVNASGVTIASAKMSFNIDVTIPDLVPDAQRDDAIAFVKDLVASALMTSVFKTGFAPT